VKRFRGGIVFKAHRLLYHSILGLRAIQKKKKKKRAARRRCPGVGGAVERIWHRQDSYGQIMALAFS